MTGFNKDPRMQLLGKKVSLQLFSETHLSDKRYASWLRDRSVVRTLDLPRYMEAPVSLEELAQYCRNLMSSPNDLFLGIHDLADKQFIGTIKAGHVRWYAGTADIGIMIGERDRWGRGLARDAIAVLGRYLFDAVGLRKLTAGAMGINPAMHRVFEGLGFRREAVMRLQDRHEDGYCDHIHFGCFAEEFTGG